MNIVQDDLPLIVELLQTLKLSVVVEKWETTYQEMRTFLSNNGYSATEIRREYRHGVIDKMLARNHQEHEIAIALNLRVYDTRKIIMSRSKT